MKPILISGIQPSGRLHLGNYLGALKNFVELQNSGDYKSFFFIADYHSLTEFSGNADEKRNQVSDLAIDFLAAGIDPKQSAFFVQSAISAHTELYWILSSITSLGELGRMTQFKDKGQIALEKEEDNEGGFIKAVKSRSGQESVNAGLLMYPILMAADILLYDTKAVPVGEDQLQHIEFARALARKFNSKFGITFIEPQPIMTSIPRLMSLDDPTKKMSKSKPQGCIFLDEDSQSITEKIKHAVTDSEKIIQYNPTRRPGIANLLLILSAFSGTSIKKLEKDFANTGYGEFKTIVAEKVIQSLEPFKKKKMFFKKNISSVKKTLEKGNKIANITASKKLTEVKRKIGLL